MENKVLTPEELSKLQELNNRRGDLIERFGILEINIQDLELQKEQLIEELSQIKKAEVEIGALLQEKYGDVNINLSTGEIISR
jgi:stress response protein YsnF